MATETASVPVPLTERVLRRLGSPRLFWMLAWAAILVLSYQGPGLRSAPTYPGLAFVIFATYANLMALWGTTRMARAVESVQPLLARLGEGGSRPSVIDAFRPVASTAGPLAVALVMQAYFTATDFARNPGLVPFIQGGLFFIGWFPIMSFVWCYATVLIGLVRLGRLPLTLVPFEEDRSLGLGPLGTLAFSAFLFALAATVPSVVVSATDLRTVGFQILILSVFVILFFAALNGLHQQMVRVKKHLGRKARGLYAEALRAAGPAWSLDGLAAQAPQLNAAETLERRVSAIQEWPFDDDVPSRLAAVLTGVASAIIARLILSRLGL